MTTQLEIVEEPQLSVLIFLICLLGVMGNLCTLVIIKKNLAFRNVNQALLFLANLAVVDLLNSLYSILQFNFPWLYKTRKFLLLSQFVSWLDLRLLAVFSLKLLTVNRVYTTIKSSMKDTVLAHIHPGFTYLEFGFLLFGVVSSLLYLTLNVL